MALKDISPTHYTPSSPATLIISEFAPSPIFPQTIHFSTKPSNIYNKRNKVNLHLSTKQEPKLQQEIVDRPLFLNLVELNLNRPHMLPRQGACQGEKP